MKKILLSLLLVAAISKGASAQISFGPEIGINLSDYTGETYGVGLNNSANLGARIGGLADIPITTRLYVQPGIFYVLNGYQTTDATDNITVTVNTLEIPVNVLWKFGNPGGDRFFVGIGPYFALNLSGTHKDDATYAGGSVSTPLNIGPNTSDDLESFDFGLGINVGYQLTNGLFARIHYQRGFLNLSPLGDADNTLFNDNFGIAAGFLIGHKKPKKEQAQK